MYNSKFKHLVLKMEVRVLDKHETTLHFVPVYYLYSFKIIPGIPQANMNSLEKLLVSNNYLINQVLQKSTRVHI